MDGRQLQQCQEILENSNDLLKSLNSLYNQEFINLCRKFEITDRTVRDSTYVTLLVVFLTGMLAGRCNTKESFDKIISTVHNLIDSSAANFPAYIQWIEESE
jgi:hypothetical protein